VVKSSALLCASYLLIVVAACSPEPDPGELCEPGTEGGNDEVGLDDPDLEIQEIKHDPGLEVQEIKHDSRIADRELGFGAPFPAGLADIVGNDTREPVTSSEELQSYPLRTVVQIELEIPLEFGSSLARGTGFLVGPRHVLTNHHVVTDDDDGDINPMLQMNPPGFSFQVYPGRSDDAVLNGGAWDVESVVWGPHAWDGFFWNGEDYALLILEDDPDRSGVFGRMGMCSPSNNTIEGLPIQTAGYPAPFSQCANSPDPGPEFDCGGWMYTQECSITDHNLYPEEFGHNCVTADGQSGSPIWVAECASSSAVCAVGLHWGKLGVEPRAKRLDAATVDYLRQAICTSGSAFASLPSFCS
jgi:V8-like Glu-specific endopeptidase